MAISTSFLVEICKLICEKNNNSLYLAIFIYIIILIFFRFNRGALLNIGILESSLAEANGIGIDDFVHFNHNKFFFKNCVKFPMTDYLALHDVDLIPVDSQLHYTWPCVSGPLHLIPSSIHPRYFFYERYAGGVLIIRTNQFIQLNGMSNEFWGWGREDDEFRNRLERNKLKV